VRLSEVTKAQYPGICGICGKKVGVGAEIARTHRQFRGPYNSRWAHKACADHVNEVLGATGDQKEQARPQ